MHKLLKHFFPIPAMYIGTIDFWHFIPLSVALILAWGHKVSIKQNLLTSFSPKLFNWSVWNLMWCWRNSSWTSLFYFWVRFIESREVTVLLTASKNLNVGMPLVKFTCNIGLSLDTSDPICFKLSLMRDTTELYSLISLTFAQGHRVILIGKQELL